MIEKTERKIKLIFHLSLQMKHTLRCMVCREILKGEKDEAILHMERCHKIQTHEGEHWWNGSITVTCLNCRKQFARSLSGIPFKRKIIDY